LNLHGSAITWTHEILLESSGPEDEFSGDSTFAYIRKMGISGLLPLLKEVQVKKHVSDFKGKR
jgi:hypothetical protein